MEVKKLEAVNVDYCSRNLNCLAEVRVKAQLEGNAGSEEFSVRSEKFSAI